MFSSTLFHPWFHPRGHLQSYDRWFRPRRNLLPLPINPPVQFQTLCTHFNCLGVGSSVRHHLPRHPWGWTTPESAHLSRPRPSPTPQKNIVRFAITRWCAVARAPTSLFSESETRLSRCFQFVWQRTNVKDFAWRKSRSRFISLFASNEENNEKWTCAAKPTELHKDGVGGVAL